MKRELVLPPDFDEYGWEIEHKGYFLDAAVRLDNGRVVTVTFYSPVRLQQDVDAEFELGNPFVAERLLVVKVVNVENMQSAIQWVPDGFYQ